MLNNMISESEYLEAQKVVDAYEEQLREEENTKRKVFQENLEKKYKECEENGGHEYRSSGGKWSSVGQMSCIDCGKTIN